MRSHTALALLGLASTALATFSPQALNSLRGLRREHVVVEVREVAAREPQATPDDATACASSALALLTDVPLPESDLLSYLMTATATDACQASRDVPQSLSSAFSSYDAEASSWLSAHSGAVQQFATACQDDAEAATVNSIVSAFASNTAAGCSVSTGLAARPTGVVAGVVAAAGLLGAAVAL
ncbi:hypothetical protein F4820DRAFT_200545 [Hypoxylon rubiginosum]|uniref:Uncharacterized protein n=1 Tax=Hypoxylon rubiginosum TaxID=110542 RepID=A0ACB9YI42_9PEZI|nr:hypothetical protein F4820DRAFT_200545 [Hypoxylon rubiginosum]